MLSVHDWIYTRNSFWSYPFLFVFVLFHHNFYIHFFSTIVCHVSSFFCSFFLFLVPLGGGGNCVIVLIVYPSIKDFWFPPSYRQLFLNLKFLYSSELRQVGGFSGYSSFLHQLTATIYQIFCIKWRKTP